MNFLRGRVTLHHGDSRDVLAGMAEASVDAVVCDPPYGLEFMGKDWDAPWKQGGGKRTGFGDADGTAFRRNAGTPNFGVVGNPTCRNCGGDKYRNGERKCRCDRPDFPNQTAIQMRAFQDWCETWARECFRVLKPGGHLVAFSGTRTYHRMVVAVEDAGFEIRDQLAWVYGSGFSKGFNLKREPICDCGSSGNPLPSHHDEAQSEHDMRGMRRGDVPQAASVGSGRGPVLLASLPEQGAPAHGSKGDEPGDDRCGQPCMEGRQLHRAGEGLPHGAEAGSPASAGEWICAGAHTGRRGHARSAAGAERGSASRQSGQGRQPTGEPSGVLGPSDALDGGALPGRGACPRCGKLRKEFEGFSTALKPSWEPIVLARKPLIGTVAANVLAHGTGALNVDGCRVETDENLNGGAYAKDGGRGVSNSLHGGSGMNQPGKTTGRDYVQPAGRFPANLIHDGSEEVVEGFPYSAGQQGDVRGNEPSEPLGANTYGKMAGRVPAAARNDTGSAARFFYTAKADADDRLGSKHPTVKPLDLMQWLVRLVTPKGGLVLDPFAGTGTTGEAAWREGMRAVLIEREAEHVEDIKRRMDLAEKPTKRAAVAKAKGKLAGHDDLPLFSEAT